MHQSNAMPSIIMRVIAIRLAEAKTVPITAIALRRFCCTKPQIPSPSASNAVKINQNKERPMSMASAEFSSIPPGVEVSIIPATTTMKNRPTPEITDRMSDAMPRPDWPSTGEDIGSISIDALEVRGESATLCQLHRIPYQASIRHYYDNSWKAQYSPMPICTAKAVKRMVTAVGLVEAKCTRDWNTRLARNT